MEEALNPKIDTTDASELITVVGVVTVLVVMIIPLPPVILDFLLAHFVLVHNLQLPPVAIPRMMSY